MSGFNTTNTDNEGLMSLIDECLRYTIELPGDSKDLSNDQKNNDKLTRIFQALSRAKIALMMLFILVLSINSNTMAQEIGLYGGHNRFLSIDNDTSQVVSRNGGNAVGFFVELYLNDRLTMAPTFEYGTLRHERVKYGSDFVSKKFDIGVDFRYCFTEFGHWKPYVMAGGSFSNYNNEGSFNQPLDNGWHRDYEFRYGIGVECEVTDKITIFAEGKYKVMGKSRLDGNFDRQYINHGFWGAGDTHASANVGVKFRLGPKRVPLAEQKRLFMQGQLNQMINDNQSTRALIDNLAARYVAPTCDTTIVVCEQAAPIKVNSSSYVLFEMDSYGLDNNALSIIETMAPGAKKITLSGFASCEGDWGHNQELVSNRLLAVHNEVSKYCSNVVMINKGETNRANPQDRRVTIEVEY